MALTRWNLFCHLALRGALNALNSLLALLFAFLSAGCLAQTVDTGIVSDVGDPCGCDRRLWQ